MWEVPHGETLPDEADDVAAVRLAKELTGVTVRTGAELLTLKHGVTRWSITMVCLEATRVRGQFRSGFYAAGEWVELAKLEAYPVSAPQRLLMDELAKGGRQLRLF
jgi:A/G-specific adenine glycosylase